MTLNEDQEINMNTTLSTKLAALVMALAINSVILGSVALVFNTGSHDFVQATSAAVVLNSDRSVA
jgi:hypothetical protein